MFARWFVLTTSVVVYLLIAALVLSKGLKARYACSETQDRGLISYKDKFGRLIVYEPSVVVQHVIKQYILESRDDKVTILCKVASSLRYVDFDVTLYDAFDRPFGVENVSCPIVTAGFTRIVELPKNTAYVCVTVNEADGKVYPNTTFGRISGLRIGLCAVLATVLSMTVSVILRSCFAWLWGGIFGESYLASTQSLLITAGVVGCLSAGIALVLALIYHLRHRDKRRLTHLTQQSATRKTKKRSTNRGRRR